MTPEPASGRLPVPPPPVVPPEDPLDASFTLTAPAPSSPPSEPLPSAASAARLILGELLRRRLLRRLDVVLPLSFERALDRFVVEATFLDHFQPLDLGVRLRLTLLELGLRVFECIDRVLDGLLLVGQLLGERVVLVHDGRRRLVDDVDQQRSLGLLGRATIAGEQIDPCLGPCRR